jgi:hypothetical protein
VIHVTETQLNEYLDQALEEGERREIEGHLATCGQCSSELDDLKNVFQALERLPDVTLERDLTTQVLADLQEEMPLPTLWKQPAFLLQSLLTLLLLALSMPILRGWGPRVSTWIDELALLGRQIPSHSEMLTQLSAWKPQFHFPSPELPFTLPALPDFSPQPDVGVLLALVIFIVMLWMVGNLSLLRGRPEAKE